MLTPTETRVTTTWTDNCQQCGSGIVGRYPGDVKIAQHAQGWLCPTCTRSTA